MRNRIANLPQNQLITTLRGLRTQFNALKQAQRTSGQSGVLGYFTQSTSTWDLTGVIGSNSDTTTRTTNFTVTFTGDGSQNPVLANLSFVVYVNGTDPAHQLTAANNSWSDPPADAILEINQLVETQLTYTQTFFLLTDKQITYFIKAYAVGSSPGTVTVTSP
jgi:hypothetical protein